MPKGSLNVSLKGADDIFSTEECRCFIPITGEVMRTV